MEGGKICQWSAAVSVIYEIKFTSIHLHIYVLCTLRMKIFEKLVPNAAATAWSFGHFATANQRKKQINCDIYRLLYLTKK